MQQCKLIIFSNFYCILSCCLNLFFMSNMLFCMYILFTMNACILLCVHVTVVCYILASFQKNKMLMLMLVQLGYSCVLLLSENTFSLYSQNSISLSKNADKILRVSAFFQQFVVCVYCRQSPTLSSKYFHILQLYFFQNFSNILFFFNIFLPFF